jgi:inner membrane protein
MDNVTHALAGVLLADATVEALTPKGSLPDPAFRRRARWASAIANNLPDLDFVVRGLTPGKVGYLLHHRGHSHTLLVATLLGFLSFLGLRTLFRTPTRAAPALERRTLLALSLFGPWVHVSMDYTNSYGVHPFWPFYDGWFYGDAVFIIEPLLLVFAVPALIAASERRASKLLLAGILAIGLGLAWATSFAGWRTALVLTLAAVASAAVSAKLAPRSRTRFAVAGWVLTTLGFFFTSHLARAAVRDAAAAATRGNGVELVDESLTPAPSNPLCWSALVVGRGAERYELFVATVALLPRIWPADRCELEPTGHTLRLAIPRLPATEHVRWDGEWSAPLPELGALFRSNCEARAFLRFARLPFWLTPAHGELYLGDLRYDRSAKNDFAEVEVPAAPRSCPPRVPPWIPPRAGLFGDTRGH